MGNHRVSQSQVLGLLGFGLVLGELVAGLRKQCFALDWRKGVSMIEYLVFLKILKI